MRRPSTRTLAIALVAGVAFAQMARAYPIAKEREIGERFAKEAARNLPILRDPVVVEYVERMGQGIVSKLESLQPFEYRFQIVSDDRLNAFAVPGGFIYLNSGVLSHAETEHEIAGVLAHEIAHVHAHHIVRQQEKGQLANYASLAGLLLAAIHPAIGAAAMGVGATAQLQYRREFEQEADFMGMRFGRDAGWEPRGLVSFLERIGAESRVTPLEVPPYLRSHPLTDTRIANLQATMKDLPEVPDWRALGPELGRIQAVLAARSNAPQTSRVHYEKHADAGSEELARLGVFLAYTGDVDKARDALSRARDGGAKDLERFLGFNELRAGRYGDAERWLRGRLEAAPDDVVARAWLGAVLVRAERFEEGRSFLERALEAAPYLDEAEEALGQSFGRSGDPGRGFFHLAKALELRGDFDRAEAQYRRALEHLPEDSPEHREATARVEALPRPPRPTPQTERRYR